MLYFCYPAKLSPESNGAFTVTFPEIPEAITSGKAADCLGCALAGRILDGTDIPEPSRRKACYMVQVALDLAPKLGLYLAMREHGMNNSQLARKLGVSETVVRRLLNPRHNSKPEKIQAALSALGKRIVVGVEDAA